MTSEEFLALEREFEADTQRIVDDGEKLVTRMRGRRKVMSKFREKLAERGAVGAAIWAINLPAPTSGFTELWEAARMHLTGLHLTCGWLAIQPKYAPLFTADVNVIERARKRLQDYGVPLPYAA